MIYTPSKAWGRRMIDNLEERVQALEGWRAAREASRAVEEIKEKHVDERFDRIEKKFDDLTKHLNTDQGRRDENQRWLQRAVVLLLLAAAGQFVLNGGLGFTPP